MFSFADWLNLPLIWGGIIALAVFLYVLLDGFDLGVGILFPFAPSDRCRDTLMNSIAPFWDGNETWLVLGGGGLFAAFPLAYAIVMPALYMPILLMLIALIFRGVAFEFRYKATGLVRRLWEYAFHFGSLFTAFAQGVILGSFVQGIAVEGRNFAGGPFDWLTGFALMTGVAVVFGYTLLGATWLVLKTEGETAKWARQSSLYVMLYVLFFMAVVSIWVPFLDPMIYARWFEGYNWLWLSPIPLAVILVSIFLVRSLLKNNDLIPYLCANGLFLLGYVGLAISLWPYAVPRSVTLQVAAAADESLSLMLVGAVILLPVILSYTAYCYYIFRGKTSHEPAY